MSTHGKRLLWIMIGLGLIARVVLAFKTYGLPYDIDSLTAVRDALTVDPLHVYSIVNGHPYNRWPYPPGFLPVIALAGSLAHATGLPFHGWVKIPEVGADGAIAWLVQDLLGRHGRSERTRLTAAALVIVGPAFWMVSAFHGQIDPFAILPAVAALWAWDRLPPGLRRAGLAGLLIGVGISIKTVPGILLLALLPSVRSRREAMALILPAVMVPAAALMPFVIADPQALVNALHTNRALPGLGGFSLVIQPSLADFWLHGTKTDLSGVNRFLFGHQQVIVAVLMAPLAALVLSRRLGPLVAASLLFLGLLVLLLGFSPQYAVWALPFALMSGHLRQVAFVEAALFVPESFFYWHPFGHTPTWVYTPIMIGLWASLLVVLGVWGVRLARRPRAVSVADPATGVH